MKRLRLPRRAAHLSLFAVIAVLASVGGAAAYFTATGTGVASASTGTLSAPTGLSATQDGTSVNLTWSSATTPGGGPVDGYYVTRTSGSQTANVCGSPSAPLTGSSTSCSDTGSGSGVAAGTYTYQVIAVFRSWTAPSAPTQLSVSGPAVTSVSPAAEPAGASQQTITITGHNFDSGATITFSNPGITVNSMTVPSASQVTANISVSASAATGNGTVSVTNPDGDSASSGFAVSAAPTITSVSPSSANQGASNDTITLTGSGFENGATVAFTNPGITVNSVTYVSQTQLTVNVSVSASASTGSTSLTVTNPDGSSATAAFSVAAAVPTITGISPATGSAGQTVSVTISGTNFDSGAQVSFSGAGVTATTTAAGSTQLTVNVTIANLPTMGAHDVTVTNGSGASVTDVGAFTVSPVITSISPATITAGTTRTETISGAGFEASATLALSNSALAVSNVSVVSPTSITATVTDPAGTAAGTSTVTVTNGDGSTTTGGPLTLSTAPTFVGAFGWNVTPGTTGLSFCTAVCQTAAAGSGDGEIGGNALAVGVDANGNVFVADPGNNRILEYTTAGAFERAFGVGVADGKKAFENCTANCDPGLKSTAAGGLEDPNDLVVDRAGDIFVDDSGANRIDEFTQNPDGSIAFDQAFGWGVAGGNSFQVCTSATGCQAGSAGGGGGALSSPQGVGVDANGNVFVSQSARISEFATNGPSATFVAAWGWNLIDTKNRFEVCTTNCVYAGTLGSNAGEVDNITRIGAFTMPNGQDLVYGSSYNGNRVDEYTVAGTSVTFTQAWGWGVSDGSKQFETCTVTCRTGLSGTGIGEFSSADGITVDGNGRVYVSDIGNSRIEVFDGNGNFIIAFGEGVADGAHNFESCTSSCQAGIAGGDAGSLDRANGMAIDPSTNEVFEAPYGDSRIDVFTL